MFVDDYFFGCFVCRFILLDELVGLGLPGGKVGSVVLGEGGVGFDLFGGDARDVRGGGGEEGFGGAVIRAGAGEESAAGCAADYLIHTCCFVRWSKESGVMLIDGLFLLVDGCRL